MENKALCRESEGVQSYEGGSFREAVPGKGLYSCMPMNALTRLSRRYEYGAVKYGRADAYKDGLPVSRCWDSAMRHLVAYMSGNNSEDHLAACVWNCMAMMYMEEEKPQWQDIQCRKGFTDFDYLDYIKGEIV